MNKKTVLWILLDLVFLIVFNTVFFVIGGNSHPTSTWISYGFIHFSYLMVCITPFLIRKSTSATIFGYALQAVSSTYFLVEFVVGVVFIVWKQETVNYALVVQIIIAAVYLVLLLSHLLANEHTADQVKKQQIEVDIIKECSARTKSMSRVITDKKLKKEIERIYDLLHASPSKSTTDTKIFESKIVDLISQLESSIDSENTEDMLKITKSLVLTIEKRNGALKSSK